MSKLGSCLIQRCGGETEGITSTHPTKMDQHVTPQGADSNLHKQLLDDTRSMLHRALRSA